MNDCLNDNNFLTNICKYLNKDSIIQFSQCNKAINKALNPANNSIINVIFLISVNKTFFEFDEEENNNINENMNLLSKFIHTKINWKVFFIKLRKSFNHYNDKNIIQKVLDCFRSKKKNSQIEYNLFMNASTNNFYSKLISKEYMIEDSEKEKNKDKEFKEIEIFGKDLYFENELKNFEYAFDEFINNIMYKNIIINAVKYNNEFLDSIYENNYYNKCNNNIIKFLLWITHLFILYSNYIYNYISIFKNDIDEKTILIEFIHKHNEIIKCALFLNSNFEK